MNSKNYATQDYVTNAINNAQLSGGNNVDLSKYALKTEIPTNISQLTNDKNYLTSIPSEYATKSYVATEISKAQLDGGDVDLSDYALKSEIPTKVSQLSNDKNYLTSIPSEYVTESKMNNSLNTLTLGVHTDGLVYIFKNGVPIGNGLDISELVGSTPTEPPTEPPTETTGSISLNPTQINSTSINANFLVNATLSSDLVGKDITWSSNNTNVATVSTYTSTSALVTTKGYGECTITATCEGVSATCIVIVTESSSGGDSGGDTPTEPTNIPCTSISVTPTSYSFDKVGQQITLTANVTPSNTTDAIIWSSSNSTVATVNNGFVTSMGSGECIITAQCGDYSDTCLISVASSSTTGDTLTDFVLTADFNVTSKNYYRVECVPVPSNIDGTIWWTSSDPAVLSPSASSGKNMTFYPGKNGTCTITVTYDAGTKGYLRKKFTANVTIPDNTPNVEILYDNPTITIENLKAKAVKGSAVQYFDVSYEVNDGHPSYNSSLTLYDDAGERYYLALTNRGTSKFGKNGLHLDSGAWITEASESSGVPYRMQQSALAWTNFNLNMTIANRNLPSALLNKAVFNFNQTLPALNMTVNSSSPNYIELQDLEDSWLGVINKNADNVSYNIILNNTELVKQYGEYKETNNRWLSTTVHELGHSLGTADSCSHHPSMYTYTRDTSRCLYLQPNDIAWIEYLHKEMYGIDLMTTQENIDAQVSSMDLNVQPTDEILFDYDYNNTQADVVVDCELEYVETKYLDIGEGFELEYHIYNIVNEDVIDGELHNKQLKVHVSLDINIKQSTRYTLSLMEFANTPCSLINPKAIIIK